MTTTTQADNRISTAEARERLTKAVETLQSDETWRAWLDLKSRQHNYSLNNLLLALLQCPDASILGGAKGFWQPMGRFPMKGSKAIRIFAPMLVTKDRGTTDERTILVGYKLVPIFSDTQTTGDPIPERPNVDNLTGDAPEGFMDDLRAVAEREGLTVRFVPLENGVNGYYDRDAKLIAIESANDLAQQAKTLCHELGHHFDLNRHNNPSRTTAEVVAEACAYVVASTRGMDTSSYSTGYVATWARSTDEVKDASHRIDQAVNAIMAGLDALVKVPA